jgi:protein-S-isoprenylcysteine O-methyltransferase Ste14
MNDASDATQQYIATTTPWSRFVRRVRVPVGFLSAIAFVWLAHPILKSLLIGGLVMVPGLVLRGLASGHVQKDKQLTMSGPYAYTRNPLYLGSLIMAAGFAIAAQSWMIIILMLIIFALIYVPVIAGEERFLRTAFPGYDDYARHVPRLFPRLTRYGVRQGEYSSARYWKHHEYEAAIGSAAMLAILAAKLYFKAMW